jgi:uncharacterized membrane protein YqjE
MRNNAGPPTKEPIVTASPSPAPKPNPPKAQPAAPAAPTKGGRHASEPTVGQLVSDASTHVSTLIHSEIELAKLELRSTVKNAGVGVGLFAAAAVVLVFSLVFGFLTLAEGLAALGLFRWLAFLIVFVLQLVIVALCVFLGYKKVKRVKGPARTIKTTRETVDYLKTADYSKRSRG